MTGICAGVAGECNLGDLLLADPAWDWQSGKHKSGAFLQAPDQINVPLELRQRWDQFATDTAALFKVYEDFPGVKPETVPRLRAGPVASGSSVLADQAIIERVQEQHRKLLGVEMEVYGVYAASRDASLPRPLTFGLKAVCDFGDRRKDDKLQAYCAYLSANALRLFVEKHFAGISELRG